MIQWPQEHPFGEGVAVDGDNPQHVMWLFRQAFERANSYSITGCYLTLAFLTDDPTCSPRYGSEHFTQRSRFCILTQT